MFGCVRHSTARRDMGGPAILLAFELRFCVCSGSAFPCVAVCLQVQAERTRRSHRYRCTAPPEPVARASSIPQNLRLRRTHPRAPCRTAGQSVSRRPAASRQARASLSRRCQRAQRDLPREGTRTWPSAERRARRTRGRSALAPPSTSGRVLTTLSLARRRAALSKARPGLAGQRGPSG